MKYSGKSAKAPAVFLVNYPESELAEINRDSYLDFLKMK